MFYYAEINAQGICIGVKEILHEEIKISTLDEMLINKRYRNGNWEDAHVLLVEQIIGGYDYCLVVGDNIMLKPAIDKSLTDKGHAELIRTDCPVA